MLILTHRTDQQITIKTFKKSDFTNVIPELSKILAVTRMEVIPKFSYFYLFYSTNANEKFVTTLKITSSEGIQIVDPSSQIQSAVYKHSFTGNINENVREEISGFALVPEQFVLTLDNSSGSRISRYMNDGTAITSSIIVNSMAPPAFTLHFTGSDPDASYFYFYSGTRLKQVKVSKGGGILTADFPSTGITGVTKVFSTVASFDYGVYSLLGGSQEKTFLVLRKSTNPSASLNEHAELKIDGSLSFFCDNGIIYTTTSTPNFLCAKHESKPFVLEITGKGTTSPSAKKIDLNSAVTYYRYISITQQSSGSSQYYPGSLNIILAEKTFGFPQGIGICDKKTLEELHFFEISFDYNTEIISNGLNFFMGKINQNGFEDGPSLTLVDVLTYTSVAECKENAIETKGFFSKKCKDCENGKFVDSITKKSNSEDICVIKSACPKGVLSENPNQCHTLNSCQAADCEQCQDLRTDQCKICKSPFGLDPQFKCQSCKTHEAFITTTSPCFDCLANNNCVDCKDSLKDCNQCEIGYSLNEAKSKQMCNKMCPEKNYYFKKDGESHSCVKCSDLGNCKTCSYNKFECSVCQDGYKPVSPAPTDHEKPLCEKKCPESDSYFFENGCHKCSENNCLKCSYLQGECEECLDGFIKDETKDIKMCYPCSDYLGKCSKCSSKTSCSGCEKAFKLNSEGNCEKECLEGYEIDPKDLTNCLEKKLENNENENNNEEILVKYSHSVEKIPSLSDLSLRLSLTYSNGTGANAASFRKRAELFEVKDLKTEKNLDTYTTFNELGNLYTFINYTESLIKSKTGKIQISVLKNIKIDNYKVIKKTEKFEFQKIKKKTKTESEVKGIQKFTSDVSNPNPGISGGLIIIDPTGAMIKLSQYISFVKRFIFLNIDYGEKLTPILENIARVKKIEPRNRRILDGEYFEIQKSSKGKFDQYFVSLNFDGKLAWNSLLYFISWSLKFFEFLILRKIKKDQKISKGIKNLLYCVRKLKFSIFGFSSTNIVFFGLRIFLHRKGYIFVKLFLIVCMILILFDLISIYKNIEYILAFRKYQANQEKKNEQKKENLREKRIVMEQMSESIQVFNLCSDGKILI